MCAELSLYHQHTQGPAADISLQQECLLFREMFLQTIATWVCSFWPLRKEDSHQSQCSLAVVLIQFKTYIRKIKLIT